jgi:cullin-associated NEDD8-dissociated protein 1
VEPVKILGDLERFVRSTDAALRIVAMTALRFSFSPFTNWSMIGGKVDLFLSLLRDTDLNVRRQAVLTLNALARASIDTIPTDSLKRNILPALYDESKPHPELIREVDYGAFKETIDDGLPLRKAVYQCLSTLLDVAQLRLNMQEYIAFVQQGLVDHPDIQIGAFQIFTNIASVQNGSYLLEVLDALPTLIMKSVKAHIAATRLPQPEQALDCLRAVIRSISAFNKVHGVEQCAKYTFFVKQISATPLLAKMQKEKEQ